MRPKSIILFERIELLAILCGIAGAILGWERTVALVAPFGFGGGFVAIVQALGVALMLLLLYCIARRASVVAKWIFVVLVVLGAINIARGFVLGGIVLLNSGASGLTAMLHIEGKGLDALLEMGATGLLSAAQTLLQLFAAWLLFRPDTAPWFDGDAA